jgi:hypothetical protein
VAISLERVGSHKLKGLLVLLTKIQWMDLREKDPELADAPACMVKCIKSPAVETVEDFILDFRFRTLAFTIVGDRVLERGLCFQLCNGGDATIIFAGDFSFPLTEV